MNPTITAIPGIAAGHWTNPHAATGCTVILCGPHGAVAGVAIRGGSPGTRETDLLDPIRRVDRVHAILLSGGSAFGLNAAAGVQQWLEERGIGYPMRHARIPIVPAAILYDLGIGDPNIRPDAAAGYAACTAASAADPLPSGSIGAGAGATVAKALGPEYAIKGGIGSAVCILPNGISVGATVAVNAWGGIYNHHDGQLIAGPRQPDGTMADPIQIALTRTPNANADSDNDADRDSSSNSDTPPLSNTTIGVIATDAALDKMTTNFIASSAHDGLALTIRPCHTPGDGDTLFCIATGQNPAPADLTAIVTAATTAVAQAVIDAIRSATDLAGVPSITSTGNLGRVSD